MVYISTNGSIESVAPPSRNPLVQLKRFLFATPQRSAAVVGVVSLCLKFDVFKIKSNPLADGRIPAAGKKPREHWSAMANDMVFVRTMTESLEKTKAKTEAARKALKKIDLDRYVDRVDFGGPDGHVAERTDWRDVESIRVTRCATTRSAITAYMCGAEVATDRDVGLLGLQNRKAPNYGTTSLKEYVKCRFRQGEQKNGGVHRRSVYRIGIGCNDNLAGYSHAFSIVAQPDGTFFWLQSFISHYSLTTWMAKVDATTASGLSGHLTYPELLAKFEKMDRLMSIDSWTDQANADYVDLFDVDKRKKSLGNGELLRWNLDHRLDHFGWDEACEYPLPKGYNDDIMATTNSAHHARDANADNQSLPGQEKDDDECAKVLTSDVLDTLLDHE